LRPADQFVEKQGRSTGRYVVAGVGGPLTFFLKKYYQLSWWQRWFTPLKQYPGPRELANIQRAASIGVPVPEPILAGSAQDHPCRSMLAVRELEDYVPLHQYIPRRFDELEPRFARRMRRELTWRLADISRRLHGAGYYHCDLYLCHFFVRELADPAAQLQASERTPESVPSRELFDLVLIDFTRLKRSWNPRWRVKDLAQLLFSSDLPGLTRTDRMRFFKYYLGCARLDGAARRLLRRVLWKASMYYRHNQSLARRAAA
jgi:heptose I phosphotransferase